MDARAAARLARGDARREASAREEKARRALGSGEVREAIGEAASLGQIAADEHAAMLAHVARAARDEVLSRAGVSALPIDATIVIAGAPRTLAGLLHDALAHPDLRQRALAQDAIEERASQDRARMLEARDEADALVAKVRARGPKSADEPPDDLDTRAERFLDATDDAMQEALARAAHALGAPRPLTVPDALVVLRAPALDAVVAAAGRGRRLGAALAPLGLDAALSRVRLVSPHRELDLAAHVVALDPPRRVDVAPSALELGMASELALTSALGDALASALVAPALPAALRRAWPGSIGRAIGAVLAAAHADPIFVERVRRLEGSAANASRRVALAIALGRARSLVASRLSERASSDRERRDRGAGLVARALAVREPSPASWIAAPVVLDPAARDADLRAALLAPAITAALRERFDEDWFRNPRASEPLRAAASRGATLSIEAWSDELGARAESGSARVIELARER
ncbi:Chromosome partition protein smc [Sandaracinus amylolyticus]|uniref:Chromosome partition protein smc n=1 Tax=Sandaracinus amylolyticus TaxID=927083 RepID=A0A0F6W1Q4_9BACT|nr:Chromosome partition protein smc [Sandaracinus amylolyticus]